MQAARLADTGRMHAVVAGSWIRTREATTWFARTATMLAAAFVALALAASLSHGAAEARMLFGLLSLGLSVGAVWLARSYARRGVLISPDGVVIRNLFRTRRVDLAEAERFCPEVPAGAGRPCPVLHLSHGQTVPVGGMARVDVVWRYDLHISELGPVCDELNELLTRVKRDAA